MKKKSLLSSFFLLLAALCFAGNYVHITTGNTCLSLKVNSKNRLEQVYFGKRIPSLDELEKVPLPGSSAYSTFGTSHVFGAALQVTHADGNTSTELAYLSSKTEVNGDNVIHTVVSMKDEYYGLFVDLHYNAYQREDIIEQWAEIKNGEDKSVVLTNFASSDLSFSSSHYYVSNFSGEWAQEMSMAEQELVPGIKIIDSKLGVRSNQYMHPCFLLALGNPAQETSGEVIGGTLAWPGNFQFSFEVDNLKNLRVLSGANPYASTYILGKGKTFSTPPLLFTYSDEGTGKLSRNFHRWGRAYGIKKGNGERSILLNNWEATYFDFDEAKLSKIINDASSMGFELFLLDDGWFGNKYPRNSDTQGLGDWQVNKKKLPNGLSHLVAECKSKGLKFGIWVEPEMVNPKSELYEKHPDWVIGQPHREVALSRNQLILDLCNPKVQEFVYNTISGILKENPEIAYVKWDCNRFIKGAGSSYLPADKQSHLWIDYSNALLRVMEKVNRSYPDVAFMACSGGGGRIDYGSMKYFDEYWISDNNDPLQRIFTQWGTQYFFPTVGLASHVSASPGHISKRVTPLKFRFDIAMAAKLGMDLQPAQMTEEERLFSKNAIETYKTIRKTVLTGDLYRILSPYKNNRTVFMYVSEKKDEAIVFNFLVRSEVQPAVSTIRLQGLDPNGSYLVKEINRDPKSKPRAAAYEGKVFSGTYLMNLGLTFVMRNEYESVVLQIIRTAPSPES